MWLLQRQDFRRSQQSLLQQHRQLNRLRIPLAANTLTAASLFLNVVLVLILLLRDRDTRVNRFFAIRGTESDLGLRREDLAWNGGHPATMRTGSCYCSSYDDYCMCTPSLAIDLIIVTPGNAGVSSPDHVWLVRRKDTNQLATMGGFVMVGETTEQAVRRELKEEMSIDLDDNNEELVLFGMYSDPRRDARRHTASAVYVITLDGTEQPRAADDVKEVLTVPLQDIEQYDLFADHKTILLDYRTMILQGDAHPARTSRRSPGDTVRSVCSSKAILGVHDSYMV